MKRTPMKRLAYISAGLTLFGFWTGFAQDLPNETPQLFLLRPSLEPSNFTAEVTNPYFPLEPGTRYRYEAQTDEGLEVTEIYVTGDTKEVMGVTTTVVRDTVTLAGEVIEDTYDWFAQDRQGNVWYFGEDVKNFQAGQLKDTAGSWEAGVDGALPGLYMLAEPRVGDTYRQEYYRQQAEDIGQVIELTGTTTVPYGSYEDLLITADWNALDPAVLEHKFYARGVGVVAEEKVTGPPERTELVGVETGK